MGKNEHVYTYLHPYNIYRLIEARYGGRVGTNIREFELNAITPISKVIRSHLNSNGDGVCFLMEIYEKHIALYKKMGMITTKQKEPVKIRDYQKRKKNNII